MKTNAVTKPDYKTAVGIDLDHFRKQVGKRTLVTPNTQAIDALIGENDQLRAENHRLREALVGCVEALDHIVEGKYFHKTRQHTAAQKALKGGE